MRHETSQRDAARALIEKARGDRAFARRLQEDPEGVLAEAGLPSSGADDLVREAPGDTQRPCMFTCSWTCVFTGV